MYRFLPLLLLPVSLPAQHRAVPRFFDASVRCAHANATPNCLASEEHFTFEPRPSAPAVSLYRLSHKVPAKARRAWRRAADAASKGSLGESRALLDEALRHDSDFAEALHMRGIFAYAASDFQRAAVWLDRAAALDAANPSFLAGAALGQLAIRHPADAERYARAALRLDPGQPRALQVLKALQP